jgi:two-component system response regulator RegA
MDAHERVLIVEPDDALRRRLETWLRAERCDVRAASSGAGGLGLLSHLPFDLVIADAGGDGRDLLHDIRDRRPDVPVILIYPPENGARALATLADDADRAARVADLLGSVERAVLPREPGRADAHAPGPPHVAVEANGPPEALRALADVEREHILWTLGAVGGNKARAARVLGLDRKTLYRRLAQYSRRNPDSDA